ncbi:hypothetical protein ACFO3D_11380 [Virgibacillus kekensis]|uniref:Uncharacterized protein n=1 Tax=Virgibacillus kekensis TaxID=202261 RepID=A0ABV9DJQ0_9BACI
MKKQTIIIITVLTAGITASFLIWNLNSVPAITYFPTDKQTSFEYANTNLDMLSEKTVDTYEVLWNISSKSDRTLYLRQDASLLFVNGVLRGIRSKWEEDTAGIEIKEKLSGEDSSYFQSISYHHGEVHYPDDRIKSIHTMTYDQLYVIDSPNTPLESFKVPKDDYETQWSTLLIHTTHQQLLYSWKQLINHFQINNESYLAVPLTRLYKYNHEPLPSFTQDQTNQIIGQLWEGLYKNYILTAKNIEEGEQLNSYIPIILFDKQNKHLIVLYELNGEKHRLIQQYPDFDD